MSDQKPRVVCLPNPDSPITVKLMRRVHKAAEYNRTLGLTLRQRLQLAYNLDTGQDTIPEETPPDAS